MLWLTWEIEWKKILFFSESQHFRTDMNIDCTWSEDDLMTVVYGCKYKNDIRCIPAKTPTLKLVLRLEKRVKRVEMI